ncbi:MAG: protein-L-isoaspartate(D-aspartate) O-methyltransferase [Acidobacteria bacterium]|nr:protein-L-isoaspartate(D-aspartate) O-methyltransferase [Acidobacteriota bacterium]
MVERQLQRRGIRDPRVLEAMRRVPRHEFIPETYRHMAYDDEPTPIGCGQTISQPYMVAAMAEALALTGAERVLEVGAGSGYHAAVLAELAADVLTIEREPALVAAARENLARTGYARVRVMEGDGSLGYPEAASFDAISVAAGAPEVPFRLLEQLDERHGRLVIPVGSRDDQELRLICKSLEGLRTRIVNYCRFVPLLGAQAWKVEE